MSRAKAFTMLEMVIALALVTVILLFTGPLVSHSHEQVVEQQFWQSFRQQWHLAQTRAQLKRQPTTITYSADTNAVVFTSWQNRTTIALPATMRVERFSPIEMQAGGYVKPATQRFYSRSGRCRYRLVIQMARGEYDVKKDEGIRDDG